DKEDVMTMVNMIMAEIKSDFGNDSTTPSVLSLKTVEEIHKDEEVYDRKDDKEENEEEKMWGDWETDFDYIADRALLKYNSNTGKRRKPDAPMISNADAWGLTPSGKPLTLSDEPETRKPSNQEETRKKYGRAPKGIRWQDWKEHVDELCKELEDKPESEDPLDDPKPESEDSISDMKTERIENEKESDG
ncbi:hypothetical protein ADUPG1_005226, partial [Aduncisulcus paluster]